MAKYVCPAVPVGRFIERTEENDQGELLGKVLRSREGVDTAPRPGFDDKYTRWARAALRNMLPMDLQQLEAYYVKKGWIRLGKDGEFTALHPKIKEMDGWVASVTKTYLESVAGGVKQLADNFLLKVNNGDDAITEGLQLAAQMQHLAKFGGYVLGEDQRIGRAMRVQGLRPGARSISDDVDMGKLTVEAAVGVNYQDKFAEIAAKLQDEGSAVDGVNDLVNLARQVQALNDPSKIVRVSTAMGVAKGAWEEVLINGMLSDPATWVVNASGSLWAPMRAMLQFAGANVLSLTGSQEARLAAVQAGKKLGAMWSATHDAWQIGWHAAKVERSIYGVGREASDDFANKGIHGAGVAKYMEERGMDPLSDGVIDGITNIGRVVRIPSRFLLFADEFTKHIVLRSEVAANGVERAFKAGIDLSDEARLNEYMLDEANKAFMLGYKRPADTELWDEYKLNPAYANSNGKGSDDLLARAEEATFQEDNAAARRVNEFIGKYPVLRPFVPFVRTPLNIIKQGFIDSSGIGALVNLKNASGENPTVDLLSLMRKQLLEDPQETARLTAQIGLFYGLGTTLYGMAMSGEITGGGPGRWLKGAEGKQIQDTWLAAGNVPYSIRVGGQWVPFDRIGEPFSIAMRMFADMGMYSSYMTQEGQEETLAGMIMIGATGLHNASFLKGVNTISDVLLSRGDGYEWAAAAQDYAAANTPFGGMLSFVDRLSDPYKSVYQGASFEEMLRVHEDTFGTGIFGKIAARFPGARNQPQLTDQLTGKPVPLMPGTGPGGLNPLQMAIPFLPRGTEPDAAWKAVYEIKGSFREYRPDAKLTAAEQQRLNGLMAGIRINGMTFREAVLRFRQRPDVERFVQNRAGTLSASRTRITDQFNAMQSAYGRAAYAQLMQTDRNVMQREMVQSEYERTMRGGDVRGANEIKSQLDDLYQRARRGY
jgi:hypothetical protein